MSFFTCFSHRGGFVLLIILRFTDLLQLCTAVQARTGTYLRMYLARYGT